MGASVEEDTEANTLALQFFRLPAARKVNWIISDDLQS